jgi:hypothetical protein
MCIEVRVAAPLSGWQSEAAPSLTRCYDASAELSSSRHRYGALSTGSSWSVAVLSALLLSAMSARVNASSEVTTADDHDGSISQSAD